MKLVTRISIGFLLCLFELLSQGQSNEKKVLTHYMGWFGEGANGRHWACDQVNTPLIGYYNSLSWAAQTYHILLVWSSGIDGLIINVNDDYDTECVKGLIKTLKRLNTISNGTFKFDFSISYDDQGLPDVFSAETKFIFKFDFDAFMKGKLFLSCFINEFFFNPNTRGTKYYAPENLGFGYDWTTPNQAQITVGQNTSENEVDWGLFGGNNYSPRFLVHLTNIYKVLHLVTLS